MIREGFAEIGKLLASVHFRSQEKTSFFAAEFSFKFIISPLAKHECDFMVRHGFSEIRNIQISSVES